MSVLALSSHDERRVEVTRLLVGFARTLRGCGVPAGPDRVQTFVRAAVELDVTCRDDVYWAGRATLCSCPEDLVRYDRAFAAYFAGELAPPVRSVRPVVRTRAVTVPCDPDEDEAHDGEQERLRAATASRAEVLCHRDLARLTTAERAEVARLISALGPTGPVRASRRWAPASTGTLDPGRTVRAMLRRGGEPARLARRRRVDKPRRLVLIVDVSGSMAAYADPMLRFAHATARCRPGTEVFTVGTRLTRVSREIAAREPDAALAAVADAVPDFSGGTRLGDLLQAFLDRWGQRGMARGAVVVVVSDGWERGDATLLGTQAARLHRLAHAVVWVNPHKAQPGFAPLTAGMAAVLPHVDRFVAGHSLGALEGLAALLGEADLHRCQPSPAAQPSPAVQPSSGYGAVDA